MLNQENYQKLPFVNRPPHHLTHSYRALTGILVLTALTMLVFKIRGMLKKLPFAKTPYHLTHSYKGMAGILVLTALTMLAC